MALISIDNLKQYLNLDLSDSANDDMLDLIIAYTNGLIEGYCGQSILAKSDTLIFSGNEKHLFTFSNHPVNAVTSVRYRITPADAWITLTEYDYKFVLSSSLYQIYFTQPTVKGVANYEVTFNYGYATTPKAIEVTAIEIATLIWKDSDIKGGSKGGRLGLSSISDGMAGISTSTSYKDYWDTKWKRSLNQFRKPVF